MRAAPSPGTLAGGNRRESGKPRARTDVVYPVS